MFPSTISCTVYVKISPASAQVIIKGAESKTRDICGKYKVLVAEVFSPLWVIREDASSATPQGRSLSCQSPFAQYGQPDFFVFHIGRLSF